MPYSVTYPSIGWAWSGIIAKEKALQTHTAVPWAEMTLIPAYITRHPMDFGGYSGFKGTVYAVVTVIGTLVPLSNVTIPPVIVPVPASTVRASDMTPTPVGPVGPGDTVGASRSSEPVVIGP